LKGHMGKHRELCPSEHGHKLTTDGLFTCSHIACTKTFTTLHSAHKHSTTVCPEYKGAVPEFPCPLDCGVTFPDKGNAREHAKSKACPKNPERIADPEYKSVVYHKIKDGKKYCSGCKIEKDVASFGVSKTSSTKLAHTCCTCYAAHAMYQSCRKRAIAEGQMPDFTLEDIQLLTKSSSTCPIFGYTLQYGGGKSVDHSATIDAYIHSEGHQKRNLRIISRRANTIKNSGTVDEMKLLLDVVSSWVPPIVIEVPKAPRVHTILSGEQTSKVCSVCRIDKSFKEYTKDSSSKTLGISSRCKRCSALKAFLSNAQHRVDSTDIPCTITLEYIHGLAKDVVVCPILKIPLQFAGGELCDNSASLDRFIPSKGYVPGNVWIISDKANRMKSDATPQEIEKVYRYMLGTT